MIRKIFIVVFILFFAFGCVDRLFYDVTSPGKFGLSISGHVTTNGGPHRVNVFRNFDIASKDSVKTGVSAKRVIISDADGNTALLSQVSSGVYETKVDDIKGKIGGIYKLIVELEDGRVYESLPDTLPPGGVIDTAYYKFKGRPATDGYIYEYEIYANSRTTADLTKTFFVWSNKMTFKAKTKPELEWHPPCYPLPDNPLVCNLMALCTGLRNIGNTWEPNYVRVSECTCCTCWYEQYSQYITLNDQFPAINGRYDEVFVDRVRQTGWNMMYKMRMEVSMQSMSKQAYHFWKAVRDQRSATSNIFQPITGKIPGNIVQTKGADVPAQGIFYATTSDVKVFYINRGDTPIDLIPITDFFNAGWYPCQRLAPNALRTMPAYWID